MVHFQRDPCSVMSFGFFLNAFFSDPMHVVQRFITLRNVWK